MLVLGKRTGKPFIIEATLGNKRLRSGLKGDSAGSDLLNYTQYKHPIPDL
jgi:hypothetical protein